MEAAAMKQTIALGGQDFEYLRRNHYFFIDKSGFIKEWWENADTATLITRPPAIWQDAEFKHAEMLFFQSVSGLQRTF